MEQIFKKELEALSVGYLKKIAKEVLPSRTVTMGASIPIIKMERFLEDQKINVAYWYHSLWKDTKLKVESSNEEVNGNNRFLIRK
jgi:hypothetical protein